ncbi:MAG TPA: protein kinase [Armatimonadota bacterium]|nr:protein kinase [Armatimonadota bacterium]
MSANTLGRYTIVREIARSNDIVYEATDTSINRRVALKELVIAPNLTGAQRRERVERFYREARAAGQLAHPNIVTIYEAGEDNGRHFIAMEYLEGQTLRDVLEIEGKLQPERAVEIVSQVCDALSYAHSRGVVHRDVKPDNIQILPNGRIKITDFGIARIMEEPTLTADGQVFGTPSYMSPEQVAGKPLDCRTDLFSLGVVLYELLTGRKPFTGDTVVTITYNIMNQDIAIPPTIPSYLDRVLRRSLAKDPNLRYQSADDMAADMDPNKYDVYQAPQPDPFSVTTMPGPAYPGQYPQSPAPPPSSDPFARMKPGDLSLPIPGKPLLSAEAKYFLKVMFAVITASGMVVLFIWLLSAGYQGYQKQARSQEVAIHLDAARKHYDQQSYQAAIDEYQQALKLSNNPETIKQIKRNIATTYLKVGMDAEKAGNPILAVSYYKQAVINDETYSDAYLFLGNAYFSMNNEQQAMDSWRKAIEVGQGGKAAMSARENIAVIYHRRGDAAYQRGNVNEAVDWWNKAVDIAPGTEAGLLAQQKIDRVGGG